jgi:hypothetical protein
MTERIEFDQSGVPHEFVVGGAHLERMDDGHWFLSIGRADGTSVAVWLYSDTPISVTYETRDAGRFWIDQVAELKAEVERLREAQPDAAAVRKAALQSAFAAVNDTPLFGETSQDMHIALEQYLRCRDAIIDLIYATENEGVAS